MKERNYQQDVMNIFTKQCAKYSKLFDFGVVYNYSEFNEKLKNWMQSEGFLMFVRSSEKFAKYVSNILSLVNPDETKFIYSMWSGYLDRGKNRIENLVMFCDLFKLCKMQRLHTSGHATIDCINFVCTTCKPTTAIVPIHSKDSESLKQIFPPDYAHLVDRGLSRIVEI